MISFVETKLFTRLVHEYLSDDEYAALQQTLLADPEAGVVIRGSGGVRKLRWGAGGRGKRGGLRIVYFLRTRQGQHLDAYALPEERCGELPGSCPEADQG